MQDVTWLVCVKTFWTRITSIRVLPWTALSPDLSPIEHIWDEFGKRVRHRKHYRSWVTHLCTSGTTFHKPLSNDWLVLCVGDAKLSLLQEVFTHVTEFHKPPYCMTISVCPRFVLIMMLRNFVDIALFVMPIWIWIIRFFSISFLYVKNIEHQTLVSFLLLTSIIITNWIY